MANLPAGVNLVSDNHIQIYTINSGKYGQFTVRVIDGTLADVKFIKTEGSDDQGTSSVLTSNNLEFLKAVYKALDTTFKALGIVVT